MIRVLYLRASDRPAMMAALQAAGMWISDAEGERFKGLTPGDALDEIGAIYSPTGNTITVDGEQVPEMALVPGYHANLLVCGEVPDLAIAIPRPANPRRVFAGVAP